MSERERLLVTLVNIIDLVARPHRCDEVLPLEVQARLWQVGVPCDDLTSREELVMKLWARKRSLLVTMRPGWGGPGLTPPGAA